jgi:hypothetical protein
MDIAIKAVLLFYGLPGMQNEAGTQHLLERLAGLFKDTSAKLSKNFKNLSVIYI